MEIARNPGDGPILSKKQIPWLLVALRLLLGPLLILSCVHNLPGAAASILVAAMLSDIFDGVIARRLKVVTKRLRVADSWVDAWFFVCVGLSSWLTVPLILKAYWLPLSLEICIQLASYAYDLVRWGRIASLHAYSAKVWGLSLYAASLGLLVFKIGSLIWVAFGFGVVSAMDAMAIKLLIPEWKHDVLSSAHAWRMAASTRKANS